jgi:hypothetical protein
VSVPPGKLLSDDTALRDSEGARRCEPLRLEQTTHVRGELLDGVGTWQMSALPHARTSGISSSWRVASWSQIGWNISPKTPRPCSTTKAGPAPKRRRKRDSTLVDMGVAA